MDQTPPASYSTQRASYITAPSQASGAQRHWLSIVLLTLFVGAPALLFWGGALLVLMIVASLGGGTDDEAVCNVAHIPLHGIVTTSNDGISDLLGWGSLSSADDFVAYVQSAEDDDTVRAILIDIDSPGGTPVAADEMMSALLATQKPVVAVVRELGASAAYWVAAGADQIIASPVSHVGSIGVTMSYLETASSTETEGSRWIDLSSGAFKDAGHPERVLREEEEAFYQGQVEAVHTYMVDRISEARTAMTHEEVATLADGRAYVGTEALRLKLVDMLGGYDEARTWIANRLETEASEIVLCDVPAGGLGALF